MHFEYLLFAIQEYLVLFSKEKIFEEEIDDNNSGKEMMRTPSKK